MEKITIKIGSGVAVDGCYQETTNEVTFEAVCLGERRHLHDRNRGIKQTLYRTKDGRLVVYEEEWSQWQGEPDAWQLFEIKEHKLQPGGMYEALGLAVGLCRNLTLDEALAR